MKDRCRKHKLEQRSISFDGIMHARFSSQPPARLFTNCAARQARCAPMAADMAKSTPANSIYAPDLSDLLEIFMTMRLFLFELIIQASPRFGATRAK
jgi:hypothetical protein